MCFLQIALFLFLLYNENMKNDYNEQTNEMMAFVTEYEIYLYSVLYQYASKYNYSWYCALHSPSTEHFMYLFISGYRKKLADEKKVLPYDEMNRFTEYDNLINKLPPELLVETQPTL